MGQGIGRLFQVGQDIRLRFLPDFPGCQGHAHGSRQEGPAALGHHVRDGLGHLLVAGAGYIFYPDGVNAPIQDRDGAVLIPGHIFVAQEKAYAFVGSYHMSSPQPRMASICSWLMATMGPLDMAMEQIFAASSM